MKRIRDDSVIDLTSDSAPKKVRSDTTTHTPVCAICHKLLSDRCMECESFETTPILAHVKEPSTTLFVVTPFTLSALRGGLTFDNVVLCVIMTGSTHGG